MLDSSLLFLCIALNTGLIGQVLLPRLSRNILEFTRGLQRTSGYLRCRLSETREKALRQRTLRLIWQLLVTTGSLLRLIISYSPSMLLAHYQQDVYRALVSIEAIAGMMAGALCVLAWRRRS